MEQSSMVQFSLSKNGVAVAATVSSDYFQQKVLPVMSSLLETLTAPSMPAEPATSAGASKPPAKFDLSVKAIAQKLGAKAAAEVLTAAAASLTFVHGKEQFQWKELLAEAQKATGYWTKSHSTNGTKACSSLQAAGTLVENSTGALSLSPDATLNLASLLNGNS